jgi:hypothetical protein
VGKVKVGPTLAPKAVHDRARAARDRHQDPAQPIAARPVGQAVDRQAHRAAVEREAPTAETDNQARADRARVDRAKEAAHPLKVRAVQVLAHLSNNTRGDRVLHRACLDVLSARSSSLPSSVRL